MADEVDRDGDAVRRFFAAAGISQYRPTSSSTRVLIRSRCPLLWTEAGLQDLKAAAGMKQGHFGGAAEVTSARWKSRRVQPNARGALDAPAIAAAEHARKAAQHSVDVSDRDAHLERRARGVAAACVRHEIWT